MAPTRAAGASGAMRSAQPAKVLKLTGTRNLKPANKISLNIGEVDRVLGGGVVPGEVVLISGEPGIGKSTLLLQISKLFSSKSGVLYVSGEESASQLSSRLSRLSGNDKSVMSLQVTEETDVDKIIASIYEVKPALVIVDSIQSVYSSDIDSFSGSMTQVRESGMRLARCAKTLEIPIIIVGQVTKEGVVAGPKVLEHVVDAVLNFGGDDLGLYRVLRCTKNRFGSTDEVGIFEMTGSGLIEVTDPSGVFSGRSDRASGTALAGVYKGSRVLLVEIEALTAPCAFGAPRRLPTGMTKARLEMLCAVLTRRAGINLAGDDVFVNIAGGLRLDDPAIDLAICMAIASSKKDKLLDTKQVFVGEVGLSGSIRLVPFQEKIASEIKRRKLSVFPSGKSIESNLRVAVKKAIA